MKSRDFGRVWNVDMNFQTTAYEWWLIALLMPMPLVIALAFVLGMK